MIDKLDLRVPSSTRFRPGFVRIMEDSYTRPGCWGPSNYFQGKGDFSAYGVPVVLHTFCKHTKEQHHKLEILETGEKSLAEMAEICRFVFDTDPEPLTIARIDLTADVPDVTVSWFREHTYFAAKQTTREIGEVKPWPYMALRKGIAQTLYGGVKPNQIRIYDKTGERWHRLQRDNRGIVAKLRNQASRDNVLFEMPKLMTFEERWGYSPEKVFTRVERQVATKDVDKLGLTHFHRLPQADLISPFTKIKFFAQTRADLSIETWGWKDYAQGLFLQQMREKYGLNEVRKFLQQQVGLKNWKRDWDKFQPWICQDKVVGITSAKLTKEFQDSTYRQIAA